jgi:hypothetical protein
METDHRALLGVPPVLSNRGAASVGRVGVPRQEATAYAGRVHQGCNTNHCTVTHTEMDSD